MIIKTTLDKWHFNYDKHLHITIRVAHRAVHSHSRRAIFINPGRLGWCRTCGVFPHLSMSIWKFQLWLWRRGLGLIILLLVFLVGKYDSSWKARFGGVSRGGAWKMLWLVRAWELGFRNREHRTQLQFKFWPQISSDILCLLILNLLVLKIQGIPWGLKVYFLVDFFLKSFAVRCFLRQNDPSQEYPILGWSFEHFLSPDSWFHETLYGCTCFRYSEGIEEFWTNIQTRYSGTSKMENHQDHLQD